MSVKNNVTVQLAIERAYRDTKVSPRELSQAAKAELLPHLPRHWKIVETEWFVEEAED